METIQLTFGILQLPKFNEIRNCVCNYDLLPNIFPSVKYKIIFLIWVLRNAISWDTHKNKNKISSDARGQFKLSPLWHTIHYYTMTYLFISVFSKITFSTCVSCQQSTYFQVIFSNSTAADITIFDESSSTHICVTWHIDKGKQLHLLYYTKLI